MTAGSELFVTLGGRPGIGVIVGGLFDRLERDPSLVRLFRSPVAVLQAAGASPTY